MTETTDDDIERFRDQLNLIEAEYRRIDPLIKALFARRKAGENVDDELRPLLSRLPFWSNIQYWQNHRSCGGRSGAKMMTTQTASEFADALGELCRRHGVMLWTALGTTPMVISPIQPDDRFHYEAKWSEVGRCFVIERVLP